MQFAIRCVSATHMRAGRQAGRQAVREGPHSNSVGSVLHNTVACVTAIAGTIKAIRVRQSE